MSKNICKIKDKKKLDKKQREARFRCKKCKAVARKEKHLCKPVGI